MRRQIRLHIRIQKKQLIRSIRRNLRQVLNTRSGSCYGSPELGITDLNDESLASSDFRREIRKSISQCILHYEPRITDVVVTAAAPDEYAPVELRFHIVATIDVSKIRGVFEFDICWTTINAIVWSDLCGF